MALPKSKKLQAGYYEVGDRFVVHRVDHGTDGGVCWQWVDSHDLAHVGEWRCTKREALEDLDEYLYQNPTLPSRW